jgi:hypothetical protein
MNIDLQAREIAPLRNTYFTVADNASCGVFVLGDRAVVSPLALDLQTCGMVLVKNGQPVAFGAGAAVLGHPATQPPSHRDCYASEPPGRARRRDPRWHADPVRRHPRGRVRLCGRLRDPKGPRHGQHRPALRLRFRKGNP